MKNELQKTDDHLNTLVINNVDGMVIVDMNGDIRFLNPAAEALFCNPSKKQIGNSFGYPIMSNNVSEIDIPQGADQFITVEMRVTVVEWEGQKCLLASLRDISDRVHMEADLRRRNQELEFINRTSQIFISTLDLNQVLSSILTEIESELGVVGSFWLNDKNTGQLVCQQASGPDRDRVIGYRLDPGVGIAGWVALNGEGLIIKDVLEDERHHSGLDHLAEIEIRSILCVPLINKGNILGVFQLLHKDVDHFNVAHQVLMNYLAAPAAIAVNNARLYTEVDNLRKFNQSIIQDMAEGVLITAANGDIVLVNTAFIETTGYSQDEAVGQNPRFLRSGRHNNAFYKSMWDSITETGHWKGEVWNKRKNDEVYPQLLNISAIKNGREKTTHYVGVFTEITKRVQMEETLLYLATHDVLTDLPNRGLFTDRLNHALERSARNDLQGAVMLLDIDHFKDINDTHGHSTGDKVLQEITDRLQKEMRKSDTVARLGGDEFTIILEEITNIEEVKAVARKILERVSTSFFINEQHYHPTVSIGISLYPEDGGDVETLLMRADIALYKAKEERNCYRFYETEG
jgi:diguanylate cyclase (GGDEF)-like protein/PAS domain S-box-containing protein